MAASLEFFTSRHMKLMGADIATTNNAREGGGVKHPAASKSIPTGRSLICRLLPAVDRLRLLPSIFYLGLRDVLMM